jgi:hypothetical protein
VHAWIDIYLCLHHTQKKNAKELNETNHIQTGIAMEMDPKDAEKKLWRNLFRLPKRERMQHGGTSLSKAS